MLVSVQSDSQMRALGASLAAAVSAGHLILLRGPIGAGKTTLAQGLLAALGVSEDVTSPTFSLVEVYLVEVYQAKSAQNPKNEQDTEHENSAASMKIWHFDLYRIEDPEELELIGFRESFNGQDIVIIEWPERGGDVLPVPDIEVVIEYAAEMDIEVVSAAGHNASAGPNGAPSSARNRPFKAATRSENGENGNSDTESADKNSSNRRVTITGRLGDRAD